MVRYHCLDGVHGGVTRGPQTTALRRVARPRETRPSELGQDLTCQQDDEPITGHPRTPLHRTGRRANHRPPTHPPTHNRTMSQSLATHSPPYTQQDDEPITGHPRTPLHRTGRRANHRPPTHPPTQNRTTSQSPATHPPPYTEQDDKSTSTNIPTHTHNRTTSAVPHSMDNYWYVTYFEEAAIIMQK